MNHREKGSIQLSL